MFVSQEELSDRVSLLIHSFHTFNNQLLYFETFLQTMKREWNGIDRLRMDKFFQLVRFVFRQVFEVLKRSEWESSLVDQFLAVFTAELLQSAVRVPDGLMLHILELYMTELARVGSAEVRADNQVTLAGVGIANSVCKHIFSTILDHASYAVEELMKELSDGGEDSGAAEEESEEEEETGRRSLKKFDYGALADCLFELGSRPLTPNFNRNKIYKLVKTDTASATITTDAADATKLQSDAVSPTPKKRKNKKQKAKELAAQISEPAEEAVEEPEVVADYKPTGKGHTRTAEEEEAAVPVQTPTRKKKSQKKHKQQLLELTEDVKEEVQLPDLSEEPVQKKSRKQKQKTEAAAEATEAAVESTTLRKTKKKRKIQADEAETSQINGKAGTEVGGTEISSINTQTVVRRNIYLLFVLEFRTTDQSLLVSPVGSSRVAFDPEKKPASGVLKSPSASPFTSLKKATPKKRPTAADFF
uniref:Ribosomal RNA processing 1B n=1 Tax=Astyanax mexicanus TaxID=7994 RepID=A0A8B9HP70_ASTMX